MVYIYVYIELVGFINMRRLIARRVQRGDVYATRGMLHRPVN